MKLVSCLYPKRIRNPYTHEIIYVPCRHCSACRNNRYAEYVNRLQIERQNYKHCIFVTLTYAPEFVPHYDITYEGNDFVFSAGDNPVSQNNGISFVQQFDAEGSPIVYARWSQLPAAVRKDELSKQLVYNAYCNDGQFRVVDKKHVQDFIKRLRSILVKYYDNAKLRYFFVSEYGCDKTTNYRPHYHGLLFTDSDGFRKDSYKVICSAWKYGFVGSSAAQTHAAGYVAKYVNSYSVYPKLYDTFLAKPFCLFSKNPAIGVPKDESQKAKEIVFNGTNDIRFYAKGRITDVPFWQSLESRFFPKCREFSQLSHSDRVKLYTFDAGLYEQFSEGFAQEMNLFKTDRDCRDKAVAKRVKHLCELYHVSLEWYVHRIEDYYATKELLNLSKFYEYQSKIADTSPESLAQLVNCYPEAVKQFRDWWYDNILPSVDFNPFGVNAFDVDTYLFRKFDPYFRLSDCKDWLDFNFAVFDLENSSEYQKIKYDNLKREHDSNKNKRLNARKGII